MNYLKSIDELEKLYVELTKEGCIGGSHLLRKISGICHQVSLNSDYGGIFPSFILSTIFNNIALDQDNRPVTTDECKELYNLLNEPISAVINDLRKLPTDKIIIQDTEKLILNYYKFIRK